MNTKNLRTIQLYNYRNKEALLASLKTQFAKGKEIRVRCYLGKKNPLKVGSLSKLRLMYVTGKKKNKQASAWAGETRTSNTHEAYIEVIVRITVIKRVKNMDYMLTALKIPLAKNGFAQVYGKVIAIKKIEKS